MSLVSHLSFGCSRLMGPLTRSEADGLLDAVFDIGVDRVDVARAYGSGEAEVVVGAFARRHPGRIHVTTKFGIAPSATQRSRLVRTAARRVMRSSPALRAHIQRRGAGMVARGRFDLASVQESLSASKAALEADFIDTVLLHDPTGADRLDEETLGWLSEQQLQGSIGRIGIGTSPEAATVLVSGQPAICSVVQIPHGVLDNHNTTVWETPDEIRCFSVVASVMHLAGTEPERIGRACAAVDTNPTDHVALSALAIAEAVDRGAAQVLFSTTDLTRLPPLAAMLDDPGLLERARRFREAVAS